MLTFAVRRPIFEIKILNNVQRLQALVLLTLAVRRPIFERLPLNNVQRLQTLLMLTLAVRRPIFFAHNHHRIQRLQALLMLILAVRRPCLRARPTSGFTGVRRLGRARTLVLRPSFLLGRPSQALKNAAEARVFCHAASHPHAAAAGVGAKAPKTLSLRDHLSSVSVCDSARTHPAHPPLVASLVQARTRPGVGGRAAPNSAGSGIRHP